MPEPKGAGSLPAISPDVKPEKIVVVLPLSERERGQLAIDSSSTELSLPPPLVTKELSEKYRALIDRSKNVFLGSRVNSQGGDSSHDYHYMSAVVSGVALIERLSRDTGIVIISKEEREGLSALLGRSSNLMEALKSNDEPKIAEAVLKAANRAQDFLLAEGSFQDAVRLNVLKPDQQARYATLSTAVERIRFISVIANQIDAARVAEKEFGRANPPISSGHLEVYNRIEPLARRRIAELITGTQREVATTGIGKSGIQERLRLYPGLVSLAAGETLVSVDSLAELEVQFQQLSKANFERSLADNMNQRLTASAREFGLVEVAKVSDNADAMQAFANAHALDVERLKALKAMSGALNTSAQDRASHPTKVSQSPSFLRRERLNTLARRYAAEPEARSEIWKDCVKEFIDLSLEEFPLKGLKKGGFSSLSATEQLQEVRSAFIKTYALANRQVPEPGISWLNVYDFSFKDSDHVARAFVVFLNLDDKAR